MTNDTLVRGADATLAQIALAGLMAQPKTLPPKLFYDEEGCRLFYRITKLPEYYLTRTELALLRSVAADVAAVMTPPAMLVEYGASDETKADMLLGCRDRSGRPVFSHYVPIDVAAAALQQMAQRLRRHRPGLAVLPVVRDFTSSIALPPAITTARLGFFPGSTIGNLDPPEAPRFLAQARAALGSGARMLVGVDLRKDKAILVPAYDDSEGITAAFNLNLLVRLNREAGADFDIGAFRHKIIWNDDESRIEMHLESLRAQIVHLVGRTIRFDRGETIHTENSYKYTIAGFTAMARAAGWRPVGLWRDPARLFSLHLLATAQQSGEFDPAPHPS